MILFGLVGRSEADGIVTDGERSWYLICDSGIAHTQELYQDITCTHEDNNNNNTRSAGGLHTTSFAVWFSACVVWTCTLLWLIVQHKIFLPADSILPACCFYFERKGFLISTCSACQCAPLCLHMQP